MVYDAVLGEPNPIIISFLCWVIGKAQNMPLKRGIFFIFFYFLFLFLRNLKV
jgi:hypothetical protein